jgi:putative transposase
MSCRGPRSRGKYGVYRVRKMHALLRRQGRVIGWDQTARLMRDLGLRRVKRAKRAFTTRPDPAAAKPADLVRRQFTAAAPRWPWVADTTYWDSRAVLRHLGRWPA